MFRLNAFLLLVAVAAQVQGHGHMEEPPQRSSLYRHPEFSWANPQPNYTEDNPNCSDTGANGEKCGWCGDGGQEATPRRHEIGGVFDTGAIVRNYTAGQTITVEISISAPHLGYYEFRICPYSENGGVENMECFNQNLLQLADGSTRYEEENYEFLTKIDVKLPENLTCTRCVFQWFWWAKETNQFYRNCADISIR